MLKLAEREAAMLAGSTEPDGLRALGVPEVVVTFGSGGSLVVTPRTPSECRCDRWPGATRPARATRSPPPISTRAPPATGPRSAARRASAIVSALLLGRAR